MIDPYQDQRLADEARYRDEMERKKLEEAMRKQQLQANGIRPPQQQQGGMGGGMSPSMAMNFIPESGGASAGASTGTTGGTGGGFGAGAAAAAPWAGLGAAIIGNEVWANKTGRRSGNTKEYLKELGSGAVGFQDGEYIAGLMPGPIGKAGKKLSKFGEKSVKKLQPWEWF
jgi:hypothetical protein